MDQTSERYPLSDEMVSIVDLCLPALEFVLKNKFNCLAIFHGLKPHPNQFENRAFVPEKRLTLQLTNGLQLSVWKDDLTTHKVDAVVNAANESLQHAGGLAQALCAAGGPHIQKESDVHIKTKGRLHPGDVVVTTSGSLPCKMIIHAVGPCVRHNPSKHEVDQAKPLLKRAVENILEIAQKYKFQSIAIPALSSGLFNFPLPVCADIIVWTIREHKWSGQNPLEVRLVNHDEPSVREMEMACKKRLAASQASYSQVFSSVNRISDIMLKVNNVTLCVKKDLIQKETMDVIVNTTATNLDLSSGAISKAILDTAGRQIQSELKKHGLGEYGDVIATKGYHLHAKYVYHTICPVKGPRSDKILKSIVLKCLSMAKSYKVSSISFPAIGTGILNFGKEEVAEIMIETAVNFAQNNPEVHMGIHFVIYPKEHTTFKAFQDKLKSLQLQGGSKHYDYPGSSSQRSLPVNDDHDRKAEMRTRQPYIELNSAFEETTREAKRWVVSALSTVDHFLVQNNFIQHFGQREYEELSQIQQECNVSIDESFEKGLASIAIKGAPIMANAAALEVECMCCKVQEEFALEEESAMAAISTSHTANPKRLPSIVYNIPDIRHIHKSFMGLEIVRVDKVENSTLKELFELKKKQLESDSRPQLMYQRIPAQFCNMVHRVGFHREYAPPDAQNYGDGIYFASSVKKAMQLWDHLSDQDEYFYFVQAQVLEGQSTAGSRCLIVPPCRGQDPLVLYDSLRGDSDTLVIFNGHLALPEYVITCKKPFYCSHPN